MNFAQQEAIWLEFFLFFPLCYSPAGTWPRSPPDTDLDHRRAWQASKSSRGHRVPTRALFTKATREVHNTLSTVTYASLSQEAGTAESDFYAFRHTHMYKETKDQTVNRSEDQLPCPYIWADSKMWPPLKSFMNPQRLAYQRCGLDTTAHRGAVGEL